MKKIVLIIAMAFSLISLSAQETITNRYSMKLSDNGDGTYELINRPRYEKIIDLSKVGDLLVPYTHVSDRVKTSDYSGIETREFVYKTYPDYELKLIVDMAVCESPAPFVIYIHGGGWARGNNGSNRPLSQYLAKQKGVAGVRIAYTLAPQPGANIEVSIQDVKDALKFIQDNAAELNIDPDRFGFFGGSAGAHLSAVGAFTTGAKVLVGVSGIYDLQSAAITVRAKDPERIAYFKDKDPKVLYNASPVNLIDKNSKPAVLLICGTGDITVEWEQSKKLAEKLTKKGADVTLSVYDYYDHNLNSKTSDLMEECLLQSAAFIAGNIF